MALKAVAFAGVRQVPQTILSSWGLILAPLLPWEFEIVYCDTVGLIAWLIMSNILLSGNDFENFEMPLKC